MDETDKAPLIASIDSERAERMFPTLTPDQVARGIGDAVVLGSNHCASTLRIKEFLTRNGHPYSFVDLDREADVQELLDRFHVSVGHVRAGNVKRVASAVGEGSIAVSCVHRVLSE